MAEPSITAHTLAVFAALKDAPGPIPEAADAALRDGLADHLEFELKRRTLPGLGLNMRDIANLVIAYVEAHRG